QVDPDRHAFEREADDHRGDAAHDHLAFCADVEQAGPETERDAEPRQRQGCRRRQGFGNGGEGAEGSPEQCHEGPADRRGRNPGGQHDQTAQYQRNDNGKHGEDDEVLEICATRGGPLEQLGRKRVAAVLFAHATAPAIAKPISFLLGLRAPAPNSATMRPLNMTRMRSDSARTSSSSEETISTPSPSSRAATMRLWMYSIEPTSRPRVGCEAISSLVSRDSSRATIIFCWLPPDSVPAGVKMDWVRTSKATTFLAESS